MIAEQLMKCRHPGHVTNDVYPREDGNCIPVPTSFEGFSNEIVKRGMVNFAGNGPQIVVDTTDFEQFDRMDLVRKIEECKKKILSEPAADVSGTSGQSRFS